MKNHIYSPEEIQRINAYDLFIMRCNNVSHLPFDSRYRIAEERSAAADFRSNTPVHDAEVSQDNKTLLSSSGCIAVGDWLRAQDDFFQVDFIFPTHMECTSLCGDWFSFNL